MWHLRLDGRQVYGAFIYPVRNNGINGGVLFKTRYGNRKLYGVPNYYSTLKEAKFALVKYFNEEHEPLMPKVLSG